MTGRVVTLDGGAPWGFRMNGGADQKVPLKVSRVNPAGKAARRGVREGDLVTSIDDRSTKNLTSDEAHDLLRQSGKTTLKLGLNENNETSPSDRPQYRTIHHETHHHETVKRSSVSYTRKESVEKSLSHKTLHRQDDSPISSKGADIVKEPPGEVKVNSNVPVSSQKSTSSSSASTSTSNTLVAEGQKNGSEDHAVASRQSSYSNCSSIPDEGSSIRNWTDEMNNIGQQQQQQYERMSKSKKRRQRRKNSLLNRSVSRDDGQSQSEAEIDELSDDVRSPDIQLEPAPDRLEVLRLKRIEHKYKVESPKELRLNRARPKLKAKSKSLDDEDDQLKIQELSEASESEEGKFQTNIIISEASSEETLLEDSDTDRRPFALQLNDDNRIESVSPLTPEEERTLRNFLGGLNLIDSPEESAKELYERTINNDPKTKKLLKRKELEEYFTPIAQNPRYLDAISEEASDLSDKESASGGGQHLKRSSPEEDEAEKPILVQTKVLEPERVFNTTTDSVKRETAEVVYIDDSNSSISSTDCEDKVIDDDEEVSASFELDLPNLDVASDGSFRIEAGESISSVLSSNTTSTKTILPAESAMQQLTPPPTPVTLADSKLKFDYTRIPNILKEKEPENDRKKMVNSPSEPKLQNVVEKRSVSAVHRSKKIVNGVVDKAEFRKVKVDEATRDGDVEVDKDFEEHIYKSNNMNDIVKGKPQNSIKSEESDTDKSKEERLSSSNLSSSESTEKKVVIETGSRVNKTHKEDAAIIQDVLKEPQPNSEELVKLESRNTNKSNPDQIEVRNSNEDKINVNESNNHLPENSAFKVEVLSSLSSSESTKDTKAEENNLEEKASKVYVVPKEDELDNGKAAIASEKSDLEADTKEAVRPQPSSSAEHSDSDKTVIIKPTEHMIKVMKTNDCFLENSKHTEESLTFSKSQSTVDNTGKASRTNKIQKEDGLKNPNEHLIQVSNSINHTKENKTEEFLDTSSLRQYEEQSFDKSETRETTKLAEEKKELKSENTNNSSKESTKSSQGTLNVVQVESFNKSESERETVLRHVVMTSQDSNKTDSQKLKEFESIRQLNNEIQDKINKKQLIGPIFRKSKSPKAEIGTTVSPALLMQCEEELPTKTFVQKRVKEFTEEQKTKSEEARNGVGESHLIESRIKTFSVDHDKEEKNEEPREEGSVLKRLLACHSSETSDKLRNIPVDVQRARDNDRIIPIEVDLKKENIIPIARNDRQQESKTGSKERIVPIEIDLSGIAPEEAKKQENQRAKDNDRIIPIEMDLRKENLVSIARDDTKQEDKTGSKERIVPIEIDLSGITSEEAKKQESRHAKDNGRIIPIEMNLRKENLTSIARDDTKQEDKTGSKERIVPIEIDLSGITPEKDKKQENRHTKDNGRIIPIEMNLRKENLTSITRDNIKEESKTASKERIVPIEIDLSGITAEKDKKQDIVNKGREIEKKIEANNKEHITQVKVEEVLKKPNRKEHMLEVKVESSKKDDAKPVTEADIRSLNKSLQDMIRKNHKSTCEEAKNEPPIPPPRRSKALLLKKQRSEEIPVSNDMTYTNVVSPPRPSSTNSDSSSSEESSKCTAKYNPNSSIGDVASIVNEEQPHQVPPLRDIVLKLLVALPFGEAILKELAEVSKTIERYTDRFKFNSVDGVLAMPLYALHQRFMAGRRYDHEAAAPPPPPPPPPRDLTSPNRLLAIIKEEPNESSDTSGNELSRPQDNDSKRLNARNLGEWLTLARHKSSSTSNLDCTSIPINNLRRRAHDDADGNDSNAPRLRRYSLPQEIYERQMIEIMEREREIQRELERLEEEKRKLKAEVAPSRRQQQQQQQQREFQMDEFYVSKRGDFAERRDGPDDDRKRERPTSMPVFPTEFFRQQMYEEYMDKYTEREERKQQKVIKISSSNDLEHQDGQVKPKEIIHPVEIEREFMDKVKEKFKRHLQDAEEEETKEKKLEASSSIGDEAPPPVLVIDGDKVKSVETLPRHLQEFVDDLTTLPDDSIWSPGQPRRPPTPPGAAPNFHRTQSQNSDRQLHNDAVSPPIWTPKSATSSPVAERKEFRPVNFKSPVLARKDQRTRSETVTPTITPDSPPWKRPEGSSDPALNLSVSSSDRRSLSNSQSVPGLGNLYTSPRLPRAQNPTVTLLQKAREGQLPRGAQYIDQDRKLPNDRPPIKYPGEVLYNIKNDYTSESDSERPKRMAELTPRKFEGVGPTTKDGMPLILRSEVKEKDQSKWYKRMYDTIHKQKPHRDEFVTIRYKQKRAQYPYSSGYLSEPEPGAYDSDFTEYKYQTLDRRRTPQQQQQLYVNNNYNTSATMPRSAPDNRSYSSSDIVRNTQEKYQNQPGRIENYRPGHSSISEKEAKQWWDEVMDIFDGHLEQQNRVPTQPPRSFMNQALKESGYESDSTLVFKRKAETAASQLGPKEQREAYKTIQKGGDVPFQGLRKAAPERPKETDMVEFFPISPTLTKIRIHKSIIPPKELVIPEQQFFCYPATVHKTFANFKRAVPSSAVGAASSPPPPPPSPPKRKSSRNNTTLRLISTMKVKTKRHETCFAPTKVNYLRDKITCKLSPNVKQPTTARSVKLSVAKRVTASSDVKTTVTSTLTTSKDPKSCSRTVQSSTRISRGLYKSGSTGSVASKRSSNDSPSSSRTSTPVTKTFGSEKRKFDLTLPSGDAKLCKTSSEELLSPTEVKKGIKNISSAHYKNSTAPLASGRKFLPIKVGITEKGKSVLKSSIKRTPSSSPRVVRRSESLKKSTISSLKSKAKPEAKQPPRTKPIDDPPKPKPNNQKCFSKATGANVAKKLDNPNNTEISLQKEAMESNHFFRNLFFRNTKNTASFIMPKRPWLIEKTHQLTRRRRASMCEPSIGAMKIYLRHTKPVTDSKFITLDDVIRSRSASPKSVTFSDNVTKRSKSLPSKLVLSQTSRPISPAVLRKIRSPILKKDLKRTPSPPPPGKFVLTETSRPISPVVTKRPKSPRCGKELTTIVRRSPSPQGKLFFSETSRPISPEVRRKARLESPPVSPMLPRSPSSRRIMQIRQQQLHEQSKPSELGFYACPELRHSNTSLDSFRSDDYQVYLKDLVFDRNEKFKELNHFYSDIERVAQLEKKFSSKPRKRDEGDIIDYDRWMEVRTREKAEHELKHLYNHLKEHEKEKGFLFLPKDVQKYKWKCELDRGLRIKEKSVENIKAEFERLKKEDSERECIRRREIAYSKDTYKPLWRGNSVVNLASILTERRSQSEGRVKSIRQKLLDHEKISTHGIGSRIWSSLSMEQVNNLKKQLQDIYGDEQVLPESPIGEYVVEIPSRITPPSHLLVRRNSESSKPDSMSEDEKKLLSQTIGREILEKMSTKRKANKLALPLVVGKEVRGAMACLEAPKKKQPEKPLVKTEAVSPPKQSSISETESASTDESTKTVIAAQEAAAVQKKVEYFEKAKDLDVYVPTVHKPAEDGGSSEATTEEDLPPPPQTLLVQSQSCQDLKEYFGQSDLVKFATLPLSATKKSNYRYTKKPRLRALDISPIRTISEANSVDSLVRSRPVSPYCEEAQTVTRRGEVKKLRRQFEFFEDFFGEKKLKRSRSENDLKSYGHVDDLRRQYEYPVHSGRGRSRFKRGVSPTWLRPEDRYMPHINIISKIASLYSFSKDRTRERDTTSRSMEELAEILGCPVGEVEKMKEKFDKIRDREQQISLMGRIYTSSPNLRELRDITPYLTANWIAHKYPRSEDNTRSLSSPDTSIASRDTSLVRKDRPRRTKSISSPTPKRLGGARSRYTKEPEIPPPPPPPPKSQGGVRNQDTESPRKYVENEVTIHYKTPVRTEIKEYVSEDELAHRQAEAMRKIYEEERKRKYLQVSDGSNELQDMKSRRHTDNFIPSQKSPISLHRYDDFDDLAAPSKPRTRSPEPRLVAKALYNFVGQTARELTFRKGDLIYVRKQVDKNWYEGELNAMIGLFPVNYVEIVPYEGPKSLTPRKAHEGQARAKYNFVAQTHLELSLAKGELVTVTRRVDDNWFEGKIGGRKGIFPVAYVDVLIDPSDPPPPSGKPVASPAAHSLLLNGSAQGKESMGSHLYTPNLPNPLAARENNGYHHAKPVQLTGIGTYSTLPKLSQSPIDQALHIETQSEPIPYRALYKYSPQNDDELELLEGDTVYVLEKCDDGWYVGSSERTGAFGTFPGNYVEKI